MNEPHTNPVMPQIGEQIFCVKIIRGKLEVTQAGTVRNPDPYKLNPGEFVTSMGSRYSLEHFWPGGIASHFNPARWPDTSVFMYCTENGKLGCVDHLKSVYVGGCIKAEETLQAEARALHQYASDAQQIQL